MPDGSWQYTDSATIAGTSWVGTPSCAEQLGGRGHDSADHDGQLPRVERLLQQRRLDRRVQHLTVQRDRQHLRNGYRPRHLRKRRGERGSQRPVGRPGPPRASTGADRASTSPRRTSFRPPTAAETGPFRSRLPTSLPTAPTSSGRTAPTTTETSSLRATAVAFRIDNTAPTVVAPGATAQRHIRLEPDVGQRGAGDPDRSRNRLRIGRRIGVLLLLRRFERQLHAARPGRSSDLPRTRAATTRSRGTHRCRLTALPDRRTGNGQCRKHKRPRAPPL